MRVLLDEDVPVGLRRHFGTEHEVETVTYRRWNGLKNGELLARAARAFDALVTLDRHLSQQQDLTKFDVAVLVLCGESDRIEDLIPLVPAILTRLWEAESGRAVEIRGEV